jgi:hypothetical protein
VLGIGPSFFPRHLSSGDNQRLARRLVNEVHDQVSTRVGLSRSGAHIFAVNIANLDEPIARDVLELLSWSTLFHR